MRGHHLAVDNLILTGFNLEGKKHEWRETPLHLVAENYRVLCVSALLLGGADKNSLDTFGRTPLDHAVRRDPRQGDRRTHGCRG